jgi:hypothetical protein
VAHQQVYPLHAQAPEAAAHRLHHRIKGRSSS